MLKKVLLPTREVKKFPWLKFIDDVFELILADTIFPFTDPVIVKLWLSAFKKEDVAAKEALTVFVPEPVATVRLNVVPSPSVKVIMLLDTDAVYMFANANEEVPKRDPVIPFDTFKLPVTNTGPDLTSTVPHNV